MPSCRTRTLMLDPIYLICHVLKPYSHDPHNPANHCTARLPLLSHCLVCVENLLLTLHIYGWDIMLNKKLVDIYCFNNDVNLYSTKDGRMDYSRLVLCFI